MLYPACVVMPEGVEMLRRVCHSVCKDLDIAMGSGEDAKVARHVIMLYANGLTDESELLQAMENWYQGRTGLLRLVVTARGSSSHV